MQNANNTILNIGFDAKRAFHNRAGLGNYSRNLLLALQKEYPQMNYILFNPRKKNPDIFTLPEEMQQIICAGNNHFSRLYWRTYGLTREIEERKIDLYHGLSHELPVGIEKVNAKSIVTIHDLIFVRHPEWYHPIDRRFYVKKYRRSCEMADRIIAISNQTKDDLIEIWNIDPKKIDVVLQGCHPIYKTEIENESQKKVFEKYNLPLRYILMVGTIEKRKNQLGLVMAYHQAKLEVPLIFVGKKTAYQKKIKNYIKKYQLKNIVVLNTVEFQELPTFYKNAIFTVYPSIYEGFGIPVLESITCGTPVITSNRQCFKDAGGDAALYVDPKNTSELGEKMAYLMNNQQAIHDLQQNGKKHIQNFTEDKIAANVMAVYQKTIRQ